MKTKAYFAYTARRLANITGTSHDNKTATKLENELLSALQDAAGAGNDRLPVPTCETQVNSEEYATWVKSLADRF